MPGWLRNTVILMWILLALCVLAEPLTTWPRADEADYFLGARLIAQGMVPYRDFFDFITPAGQYGTALLFKLFGYSVIMIRLLVVLSWLAGSRIIFQMAKRFMPLEWCWLATLFVIIGLPNFLVHQHHYWSGWIVLLGTYCVFLYLENPRKILLLLASLCFGLAPWITQSSGGLALTGLLIFSIMETLKRHGGIQSWFKTWGAVFGGVLGVSIVFCIFLIMQGAWAHFYEDTLGWLSGGHYAETTLLGYYPKLWEEIGNILLPLNSQLSVMTKIFYGMRLTDIPYLFLIGCLPLLGFLGWAIFLWHPNAELLRNKTEGIQTSQLRLIGLIGLMMILATFSYGTSLHFISNGSLAFLFGFIVLHQLLTTPLQRMLCGSGFILLYVSLFMAALIHSTIFFMLGTWLPSWGGSHERLTVFAAPQDVKDYLATIEVLNQASQKNQRVLVLYQSPDLYLAARGYQNTTRFRRIIPVYTSNRKIKEIMADIDKNKPVYIIDDQTLSSIQDDSRFQKYSSDKLKLPQFENLERYCYKLSQINGRYKVYKRVQ